MFQLPNPKMFLGSNTTHFVPRSMDLFEVDDQVSDIHLLSPSGRIQILEHGNFQACPSRQRAKSNIID